MPVKTRFLLENACYHIYARGNDKQRISREEGDYRLYLRKLRELKRSHNFLLPGYCLMPNHIHLFVSQQAWQ